MPQTPPAMAMQVPPPYGMSPHSLPAGMPYGVPYGMATPQQMQANEAANAEQEENLSPDGEEPQTVINITGPLTLAGPQS